MEKTRIKPELLAPAGSIEKCRIAFLYGADAVYAGGKNYSLRNYARNLNDEELAAAAHLSHSLGKKLYVTVNTFARETDLDTLPSFLGYLQDIRADGVIVSDPGVVLLAKRWSPQVPIHLSTQSNTTNSLSARFWQISGVRRINLARELTFSEIERISASSSVELEAFVHGAMCISYSGRCLLSSFLNDRSANLGLCSQPCRWSYSLVEEKRPGQHFPIRQDSRGTYIFNSKDLCLLEHLGKLMSLRLHAFKIEGRMKGALYLATVVRTYRQAIDAFWGSPEAFEARPQWISDLECVSHRPYTSRFLFPDRFGLENETLQSTANVQTHTLAGIVRSLPETVSPSIASSQNKGGSLVCLEVRSRLSSGDLLEFLFPNGTTQSHILSEFGDLNGAPRAVAHPNNWVQFNTSFPSFPFQVVRCSQTRSR